MILELLNSFILYFKRKGLYPPPAGASDILGLEAVGIVDALGSGVTKWKVGDKVMTLLTG